MCTSHDQEQGEAPQAGAGRRGFLRATALLGAAATAGVALPGVAGLHVISFGRDGAALRLCERLGNPSRTGKHGKEDVGHGSAVQV